MSVFVTDLRGLVYVRLIPMALMRWLALAAVAAVVAFYVAPTQCPQVRLERTFEASRASQVVALLRDFARAAALQPLIVSVRRIDGGRWEVTERLSFAGLAFNSTVLVAVAARREEGRWIVRNTVSGPRVAFGISVFSGVQEWSVGDDGRLVDEFNLTTLRCMCRFKVETALGAHSRLISALIESVNTP